MVIYWISLLRVYKTVSENCLVFSVLGGCLEHVRYIVSDRILCFNLQIICLSCFFPTSPNQMSLNGLF